MEWRLIAIAASLSAFGAALLVLDVLSGAEAAIA